MSTFKKIMSFVKDVIAPKQCYGCGKKGSFLCNICYSKQSHFEGICYLCKRPSQNFIIHKNCFLENKILDGGNFNNQRLYIDRIFIWTHYKNRLIKKLIAHFKFFRKTSIGRELSVHLSQSIQDNLLLTGECQKDDLLLIPVPLHFFRRWGRGFNQSEVLAKSIGQELNIEYKKSILLRRKYTRQQSKLSKEERLKNLNNCFSISKKQRDKLDKKVILLIDDVVSSGTTLNEIAKVLKQNGAKKVVGVCLASD